ncbi:ferrous iron transporter A [Borrelia venezuelensis]|uniref:ferrous iron transporter A n=1 Tax=Borrelia venezuelensis TaxID=1653839 RepID=UPI001FF16ED6|nr:ferrous iron transporter A [Borrelia venezuelensis]UPA12818.1 ferrous iron transporter A [Borrelia venezuelensis]
MKFKNKYVALGLFLSFISCDLIFNDEIKEESLGLLDKVKVNSVLDASEKSVRSFTKKRKRAIKKRPSTSSRKSFNNLAQNVVSGDITSVLQDELQQNNIQNEAMLKDGLEINDVILNAESPNVVLSSTKSEFREEKIQKQQDIERANSITAVSTMYDSYEHARMTHGSSTFLSSESGELKETIERNEIDFTIDSDLRPEDIAGSNTISYIDEIEEDYDQYYLEDDEDEYDEEEIRLDNRYKSYLESVRYNVGSAINTIDKIFRNYILFENKQTKIYYTHPSDTVTKAKSREEAKEFTKENLEKDLKTLLDYIQVSAKTATNFVYIMEIHAKSRLDKLATEVKSLISKVQGQSNPYEAYKAIVSPILQMKDSLKVVQGAVDKDGPWY